MSARDIIIVSFWIVVFSLIATVMLNVDALVQMAEGT